MKIKLPADLTLQNQMNINNIRVEARKQMGQNKNLRYGQAIFNKAFVEAPGICLSLVGSEYDCFYDDSKVEMFLERFQYLWKESERKN